MLGMIDAWQKIVREREREGSRFRGARITSYPLNDIDARHRRRRVVWEFSDSSPPAV
jgi:hypothetical protein